MRKTISREVNKTGLPSRSSLPALAETGNMVFTTDHAHIDEPFEYGWPHSLAEIVNSLIQAGLQLEFLHEFPFVNWPTPFLEKIGERKWELPEGELPLFFSLRARKP